MTRISGFYSFIDRSVPTEWADLLTKQAEAWPAGFCRAEHLKGGFALVRNRAALPSAQSAENMHLLQDGIVVMFDGRLDNSAELAARLRMAVTGVETEDIVRAAYRKWGLGFPAELVGDFAIVILDENARQILLARDYVGTRPLFYAAKDGIAAFASTMDALLTLPLVDAEPNVQWIADFLESIEPDACSTPYCDVYAVPPATAVILGPDGTREVRFWRPPDLDTVQEIDGEEATIEYRRLFDQAIACRIGETETVACELSGGLDSTSIAVSAAPMLDATGRKLHSFSHVLAQDPGDVGSVKDEKSQIKDVLAGLANAQPCQLVGGGERQTACLAAAIGRHGGLQRRDLNAIGAELPNALQSLGAGILLSGFGGDQVATYQGAGYPESIAAGHRWGELADTVPGGVLSMRYWMWRTAAGRAALGARAIRKARRKKSQAQRVTRRDVIGDRALLERRLQYRYRLASGTIAQRERALIVGPNIGHRLQDCAITAGAHGFEYVYPMLDIRLVEFCLTLPSRLKRTPTVRRRMIREAMTGRLPDSVRLRDDKSGTTVPSYFTNHIADLDGYEELYRAHADDPFVTDFVDMDAVLAAHSAAKEERAFDGAISKRQLMKVAELCLWSQWLSRRAEP